MRLQPGQMLATVNGRALRLADLMPIEPHDVAEHEFDLEVFKSRLERAIDLRLTFDAALAEGVNLRPEQEAAVDRVRQSYADAGARAKSKGLQWTSTTEAQIEFEQSLTHALLLQQRLIEERGGPSPAASTEYNRALAALRSELRAGATIVRSSPP